MVTRSRFICFAVSFEGMSRLRPQLTHGTGRASRLAALALRGQSPVALRLPVSVKVVSDIEGIDLRLHV